MDQALPWLPQALATLTMLLASLALLPALSWPLWMVRFGCIEARPITVTLGLLAIITAVGWGDQTALWLGTAGLLAAVLPLGHTVRVAQAHGVQLSWLAWAPKPSVLRPPPRPDVVLDPERPELLADMYPSGPSWVLVLHGGSWQRGDKGEMPHVSFALAEAGHTVFDLRYRLAPDHPFPAGVEDVCHAVAAIRAQAADLGVDPDRGVVLGRSAGGHLALLAAHGPPLAHAPRPSLAGVIGLYAPTDLLWGHGNPFVPDVVDGTASIETYLGGPPEAVPEQYDAATVHPHVGDHSPPTLLVHGEADRLVCARHARVLAAALDAAGRPHRMVLLPHAEHGFDHRDGGLHEQISRAEVLSFVDRVTARREP